MNAALITGIIDKYLQKWIDMGLNRSPRDIEPEMADAEGPDEEGWTTWYPITSTATDDEIENIERTIGHALPPSYKVFLKHKHFYELHIAEAEFDDQEIRGWKASLVNMAFNEWAPELLIKKGYIPFANWSDWGMLCFDTNHPVEDNEYPVILWDHDDWANYQPFSEGFQQLLEKLDGQSEENVV